MVNNVSNGCCGLTSAELKERSQVIQSDLLPNLRRLENKEEHIVLSFSDNGSLEEKLQCFVDLGENCCDQLQFDLQRSGDAVELNIASTEGGNLLNKALQTVMTNCCFTDCC